ncbi:phosphoglycerate dehydrogenase [Heliorestis acidaminivorans]|uniref:D-3-phosphoglycerate dehydrogenase n=1 Tax=Heliorestis acidaminivorans TaxID=553427 RepID=A0A6I0F2Q7_9FIRM|nr:phosphoglycerate dehydrogenase [Heliorestis acidaminivorans]KAB2952876.1 phosphoglycerate dehydrogenase [Heliorestis acidaminivorans]
MRVLVCDPISQLGIDVFQAAGNIEVDVKLKQTEDEIVNIVADYEAIIVRSETKITKKIIEAADKLKVIGRAGVGVDNIDVEAATQKGVVVVNAPEGNTIAAAELTIGHIVALARNIAPANDALKGGAWARSKYTGMELKGKKLGILGMGKIGSEVAKRARAFDMIVYAYDPYVSEERARNIGVQVKDLDTVIRESDIISIHMPKTKDTYRLLNAEKIAMMKDGVYLVNCARGGIIDEEALYEALVSGKVAKAGLDVFEKEPMTESPLFGLENVLVTPHLGASTKEAQVNVAVDVAHDIVRVLRGEAVSAAVNIPAVKPELMDIFRPYLDLVERLGRFLGQVTAGSVEKITIAYAGDLAQYNVNPLTTTILKGLLRPTLQDAVNYVNAPFVAKARGIKVTETKTVDMDDYANLITVEVVTSQGSKKVSGTIMQKEPRFVRIDDFSLDMAPIGHMLVMPHIDKPRIIGRTGTIIGEHNVNIAGMHLGRKELGGPAIAILNIDGNVPEEAVSELKKIDGVQDVKYVNLK